MVRLVRAGISTCRQRCGAAYMREGKNTKNALALTRIMEQSRFYEGVVEPHHFKYRQRHHRDCLTCDRCTGFSGDAGANERVERARWHRRAAFWATGGRMG